jgi:hypothetical protein
VGKVLHYTVRLVCLCIFCVLVIHIPIEAKQDKKNTKATVNTTDCRKCHEDVIFTIRINGGAHQNLCGSCHRGHPPADVDIIPLCSQCHNDNRDHFQLENCLKCHIDPHAPLEIRMTHDITAPCLSCHGEQMEQLQSYPSIHTILACTACHNYHGQIQPCSNCHLPHSDTMRDDSCTICHKAHMPLEVHYDESIPSEDCGSCHVDVYKRMVVNTSKHRSVACVNCHSDIHGAIPECEKCHGRPHNAQLHSRFDSCGECHGLAHNLEATATSTNIFVKTRD